MYNTVAIFRRRARWDSTLPAPDDLEVGLRAILPQVRARILALEPRPASPR